MTTRVSRKALSRKLGFRLHALSDSPPSDVGMEYIYKLANKTITVLETYRMPMLRLIDRHTENADMESLRLINSMIKSRHNEPFIRDVLTYLPLIDSSKYWAEGMIQSLQYYRTKYAWFPQDPTPEQEQDIAAFLIAVHAVIDWTMEYEGHDYGDEKYNLDRTLEWLNPFDSFNVRRFVLTDERMVRLLFERPDSDLILSAVKDRGTLSYDVIHPVITHSVTAINAGVL